MQEQETQLNSSDLAAEVPIGQSVEMNNNLFKVRRKGDKIFQVGDEDVTMLNGAAAAAAAAPVQEPLSANSTEVEVDEVSSGESLYKTFSFDKTLSVEETEKCISFWRGIVEKNLEPIKCSLIDGLKNGTAEKEKKKPKKKKAKSKKSEKEDLEIPFAKNNAWFKILRELQDRKLQQTKLMMGKRCRFCHYIKGEYETDPAEKEVKRQIQELDTWTAEQSSDKRVHGSKFSLGSNKIQQRKKSSVDQIKKLSFTAVQEEEDEEGIVEQKTEDDDDAALVMAVKQEAELLEYVDAIVKKKEEGAYSDWRQNQMLKSCKCEQNRCDCNVNPAIVAVEEIINRSTGEFMQPISAE